MEFPEVKLLRSFEDENARLKKLLDEAMLDKEGFRRHWARSSDDRPVVSSMWQWVCRNAVPASWQVCPCLPAADVHLSERNTELALERRRFGYRRVWQFLRCEDLYVNHKRVYRIYHHNGLSVDADSAAKGWQLSVFRFCILMTEGGIVPKAIPPVSGYRAINTNTPQPKYSRV